MKKLLLTEITLEEFEQLISKGIRAVLKETHKETHQPGQDELLTVEEAAKLLKVSKVSLHNWKKNKGLKYHKIGRSTRFLKSELLEFVADKNAA